MLWVTTPSSYIPRTKNIIYDIILMSSVMVQEEAKKRKKTIVFRY